MVYKGYWIQPQHHDIVVARLSGNERHILPFVDVKLKERNEHASEKEEGMEDNRGSYIVSMHGSTLATLNVLITL